jgi:hypothetical protein
MTAIILFAVLCVGHEGQGDLLFIESDIRAVDEAIWIADMDIVLIEADCFLALAGEILPEGVDYRVIAAAPVDLDQFRVLYAAQAGRTLPELPGEQVLITGNFTLIRLDEPVSDPLFVSGIGWLRPLRVFHSRNRLRASDIPLSYDPIVDEIVGEVSEDTLQAVIAHMQSYGTRYTTFPQYDACADWADTKIETYGISSEQQRFFFSGDSMSNVIGEMIGTENPDQIYIICAHLDSYANPASVAPGADDNASGSACVMEAARVMAPYAFKNTVRFVLFAAEEQWMIGSEYYVNQAFLQGENILGAINMDMILYAPYSTDSVFIPYDDQSEPIALLAGDMFSNYAPDVFTRVVYDPSAPSDHASFWQYGYSAIEIAEASANEIWGGYNPNYHTQYDLLDYYLPSFPYGTDLTRAAIGLLATLAEPTGMNIEENPDGAANFIRISSNPCSGVLGLSFQQPVEEAAFRIFNMAGRIVADGELQGGNQYQVDLNSLPDGIYAIVISGIPNQTPLRFVLTR